jgi:hypothetical protein
MDLQHGVDMDTQHGITVDMQHGHGNTVWA